MLSSSRIYGSSSIFPNVFYESEIIFFLITGVVSDIGVDLLLMMSEIILNEPWLTCFK